MTEDALLLALVEARDRKEQADQQIRMLLAYARELSAPRPYRLADLAQAAGMSISGVRVAYGPGDIDRAAQLLGPPDNQQFRDRWRAVNARCDTSKHGPGNPR